jgi:hypothetical protein
MNESPCAQGGHWGGESWPFFNYARSRNASFTSLARKECFIMQGSTMASEVSCLAAKLECFRQRLLDVLAQGEFGPPDAHGVVVTR